MRLFETNVLIRVLAGELDCVDLIALRVQVDLEVLWRFTIVFEASLVPDGEVADGGTTDTFLQTEPLFGVGFVATGKLERAGHDSCGLRSFVELCGEASSFGGFVSGGDIGDDTTPELEWSTHTTTAVARVALSEALVVACLEVEFVCALRAACRVDGGEKRRAGIVGGNGKIGSSRVVVGSHFELLRLVEGVVSASRDGVGRKELSFDHPRDEQRLVRGGEGDRRCGECGAYQGAEGENGLHTGQKRMQRC